MEVLDRPRAALRRADTTRPLHARVRTAQPDATALVEAHLPMVERIAASIGRRLPRHIDHAHLVQAGALGLMDAAARFEPAHGVRFETFAAPRVKGAIMDALRKDDWAPRSVRRRAAEVDAARAVLQQRLRRTPTAHEVGAALHGASPSALETLHAIAARPAIVDEPVRREVSLSEGALDVPDAADLEATTEVMALRAAVRAAIETLGARERSVLELYYFEDRTLKEICAELGITESGVWRARARALRAVGAWLAAHGWSDQV